MLPSIKLLTTPPRTRWCPSRARAWCFRDEDSANTSAYGIGLLAGYRASLAESSFYLSGEVDIALHGGTVEGQLAGNGESSGRNQLGESWPDHWSSRQRQKLRLHTQAGRRPWSVAEFLRARRASAALKPSLRPAITAAWMPVRVQRPRILPTFVSGTDSRDLDLQGWTAGLGLEKALGQQLALRAETRYSQYASEDWVTPFDDVAVTVPAVLEANEASLSLRLARYF